MDAATAMLDALLVGLSVLCAQRAIIDLRVRADLSMRVPLMTALLVCVRALMLAFPPSLHDSCDIVAGALPAPFPLLRHRKVLARMQ